MNRRVVVTGLGAVTAHGISVDALWNDLKQGISAIRPLEPPYDCTGIKIGAMVPDYDGANHFSSDELSILDRFSQFAVIAAKEAVQDAGLQIGDKALTQAAAIIGSGCGGKQTDEETYEKLYKQGKSRAHPMTIPKGMPSAAASMVSTHLGLKGPTMLVSSACASGAHAAIQGAILIQAGIVDVAVVGASDAPFTYGLLKSWEALRVTTNDTCRPFCKDRSGIVLGEGAGMIVLESEEHANKRNADIYATIAGYAMNSDAGHITRPDPEGVEQVMLDALASAGIDANQIDHINAHGTGTEANDTTESAAICKVFGSHAPEIAISATKSMHGHVLGASSAIELIATILAMKNETIPPIANFTTIVDGSRLKYTPNSFEIKGIRHSTSNSFAFGGLNASLVISLITSQTKQKP